MPKSEHSTKSLTGYLRIACLARAAVCLLTFLGLGGCIRALYRDPFPELPADRIAATIDVSELRAELSEYRDLVEETTPLPYLFRSEQEVTAEFERIAEEIRTPMTRRQYLPLLRRAAAAFGIGHLYVLSATEDYNAWLAAGGRPFPLRVEVRANRLVNVSNAAGPPTAISGETVEQINGVSAGTILQRLRSMTSAETSVYRDVKVSDGIVRGLWELGFEAPYSLRLRAADGTERTAVFPGARGEPQRSLFAAAATPAGKPAESTSDFEFSLRPDGIGVINWRSMNTLREAEWRTFLDESFGRLRETDAKGLIVDLRQNGGGNSRLADPLLRRIARQPYRLAGGKRWRKSRPYDEFLASAVQPWAHLLPWRLALSTEYAMATLGSEWLSGAKSALKSVPAAPEFGRPVCFLIGPRTFSSAMMVADAVRTFDLARLYGEPTGGVPNSHGEIGFRRLRHSGLVVSFCSALFVRCSGDESDAQPVLPHEQVPALVPGAVGDPTIAAAAAFILSAAGGKHHSAPEIPASAAPQPTRTLITP